MIKLWDYATCSCGKRHNDEPLLASERVPQTIKCSCGKRVGWAEVEGSSGMCEECSRELLEKQDGKA